MMPLHHSSELTPHRPRSKHRAGFLMRDSHRLTRRLSMKDQAILPGTTTLPYVMHQRQVLGHIPSTETLGESPGQSSRATQMILEPMPAPRPRTTTMGEQPTL